MGKMGNIAKKSRERNEFEGCSNRESSGKNGNIVDFSQEWDDPVFFDDFMLEDIPDDVLPSPFREFASALSERLETPQSATILCILSVLATALQNKFVVQIENDYAEPLNLYMMVAMPPANRKSAILKSCIKPIVAYEIKQREVLEPQYKKDLSIFLSQRKLIENERKKLSADNQEAIEAIAEKEALLFEPPALPKLFLTDATTESFASPPPKSDTERIRDKRFR